MPSLHLWLQLEDFYAKGFSSLLDLDSSTTTCNTHIDRAFSNIFDIRATAGTFETTYSYHSGISVSIQTQHLF